MRTAEISRRTKETQIEIAVNLDGQGSINLDSGIPFLDHMLHQIAYHGGIDLTVKAVGDLNIDEHHLVEDIAIVLGQVIAQALGDWKGLERVGFAYLPMDEVLARVALDFSGRPYCVFEVDWFGTHTGGITNTLWKHFFSTLSTHMRITLHASVLYGEDDHHKVEALFKGFARALKMAIQIDSAKSDQIPSTKGLL